MSTIRLQPGDEARVEQFLLRHADTSLFLRSNMRAAGLAYSGQRLEGTWLGVEEQGELVAVACHAWNGNLILQAPVQVAGLSLSTAKESGRPVRGIIGPWEQLTAARAALGLAGVPSAFEKPERLYGLSLTELIVPAGSWEVRRVTAEDFDTVAQHRAAYVVEALGETPTANTLPEAREALARMTDYFVLRREGRPVSSGAFNARVPDCVQLGGIFTPPEERRRGHARRLVAGMLLQARADGVTRAVLFTPQDNFSAQKSYEAVGFRAIGEYGLVLWQT